MSVLSQSVPSPSPRGWRQSARIHYLRFRQKNANDQDNDDGGDDHDGGDDENDDDVDHHHHGIGNGEIFCEYFDEVMVVKAIDGILQMK